MNKFNIILFGLLILGISFVSGAMQPAAAQVSQVPVLEDNPERLNDADANKVLAPDLGAAGAPANGNVAGAAGLPGADDAARNEVRIGNVLPAATLEDDALDEDDEADDNRGRNRRNRGADKILEIKSMVSNDGFNSDVFGVQGSEDAMSIKSGKASLDRDMNLEVRVKGLRLLEGQSAGDAKFSAGVACMDSGYVKASGKSSETSGKSSENGDDFTLDEDGDGRFEGHVDLQGASCVAPTVMVVNENGQWVAIAGHSAATDDDQADDNQGNDDADDNQGNDDLDDDNQDNNDQNDEQNDDDLDDDDLDDDNLDDDN